VSASAVLPANPAMILPPASVRTLRALDFRIVLCRLT
jgi:hypothetical protein